MSLVSRALDRWCARQREIHNYVRLVGSQGDINTERFYPLWPDEWWSETGFFLEGGHPWWAPFNVFVHKWTASDVGRPHNHPRWNMTLVLSGNLVEVCDRRVYRHGPGSMVFRSPHSFHKLFVPAHQSDPVYTLFFVGRRNYTQQLLLEDGSTANWHPFDQWVDGHEYGKDPKPAGKPKPTAAAEPTPPETS